MADSRAAIRDAFDERAASYDDSSMHRDLADATAKFALDGSASGVVRDAGSPVVVLDVATGTGLVLRALAARHPGLSLTGIDLSPGMLAVARVELPSATFVEADATTLPIDDGTVDLATCVTGLHLIPDTTAVLAEWRRVLRPEGRAVIAVFAEDEHGHAPVGHARPGTARTYPVDHSAFSSPAAVAATAAGSGFDVSRHAFWEHGHDRILLAELRPSV